MSQVVGETRVDEDAEVARGAGGVDDPTHAPRITDARTRKHRKAIKMSLTGF